MSHLFRPLRKLQWQLSLSYMLVVVIAIPVLFSAGLALVALTPSLPLPQQLVQVLARDVVPQVPRPIESQNPDARAKLNAWAVNLIQSQHPAKGGESQSVAQLNVKETQVVALLDHTGRLAGSDPLLPSTDPRLDPTSFPFFLQKMHLNAPAAEQIVQAAMANEKQLAALVTTQPDGQALAAVPVLDSRQNVSGVLFVSVRGLISDPQTTGLMGKLAAWLPWNASQPGNDLTRLLLYALLLLLVFSVIGTLIGILTARRITGRLQRITTAAHAWSEGNFQTAVFDYAPDELGQLTQDLNHMARQIEKLLGDQQRLAELQERQRVARDLHDSVKQQAFALMLLLGAAQSHLSNDLPSAQMHLQRAGELADQIRQELTAILQQLRPVALTDQGLQAALRDHLRQWSLASGIAYEFPTINLPEGAPAQALRPDLEEALFRVAQEALANAARHSQASRVRVEFEQMPDQICLRIVDNGQGFAVEQTTGCGHGLTNMRDRMAACGGTFSLTSVSGETVVTGCIPLAQEVTSPEYHRK